MAGYIDRDAVAQSLILVGAKTALTLQYNDHRPTPQKMRADLAKLKRRLDRAVFGRHFDKMPATDLTQCWAVIEGAGSHPHMHVGLKLPDGGQVILAELLDTSIGGLKRVWEKLAPSGSYDLTDADDGWATYATKELTSSDHVIFLPDPV
jgi:hypothetical protein